ncbi:unnamed protein product, partial [Didymodactylos carnosus]
METKLHSIWCELFGEDNISYSSSYDSIGVDSLVRLKLLSLYRKHFGIRNMKAAELFQYTTIEEHARLIKQKQTPPNGEIKDDIKSLQELTYQTNGSKQNSVNFAPTSYVQNSIWLNEQQLHSLAIWNLPLILKIRKEKVSISRLHSAILAVITKHKILRTSYKRSETCILQVVKQAPSLDEVQRENYYSFQTSVIANLKNELLEDILQNESIGNVLDLERGIVLRCHLIKDFHNDSNNSSDHEDLLYPNDLIFFNFHHIAFDRMSLKPFLSDLQLAYSTTELHILDATIDFQYIDHAIDERKMIEDPSPESEMNRARIHWQKIFEGYNYEKTLRLPYDFNIDSRSGRGDHLDFEIDEYITTALSDFARQSNITMFELLITCFYLFLSKLTDDNDVCMGSIAANRHTAEVQNLIGMFVNFVPYRLRFDPTLSFKDLTWQVHQTCSEVSQYSYLPSQEIIP